MAAAEVMAMPLDEAPSRSKEQAQATTQETAVDTAAAQDVYVKLKSLQKHMEFLDIQVRGVATHGRRGDMSSVGFEHRLTSWWDNKFRLWSSLVF